MRAALVREGRNYDEAEVDTMFDEAELEGDALSFEQFYKLCKICL